jgi:hypothetical protein
MNHEMEPAERFVKKALRLIVALCVFIIAFAIGEAFGGVKGLYGVCVFVAAALAGALGFELLKSVRH